jgi:putative tryptophan/tyrosine transport system substrate-binding protein
VQSFARPGTNVTGMSAMWEQVIPKFVQLLLETNPKITRISMLYDDSIAPQVQDMHLRMAGGVALSKGLTIAPVKWSTPDELRVAFDSIWKSRPDALLLVPTFKAFISRRELAPEIRRLRVPSVGADTGPTLSESGTLFGFGTDALKQTRRSIRYVDQILKGANPSELAIEQYGIYDLAVNLSVARELGLTIPLSILIQANRVIE